MQPLVSVIVPVYKVEEYLIRCLDSLCRQSLKNIEILLIDDASPDRCGDICEQYATKDTRFKVIHHKENKGLSVARNTGIRQATADFLMFVDSDDYVHEDFCKDAYECAVRHKADLVMFRHQKIDKTGKPAKTPYSEKAGNGYKTRDEAIELMQECSMVVWNKLYRKELFKTISYPPGYMYEDWGTTYKLIWQASRIYHMNKVLYYNCYRNDSITTLKTKKSMQDKLEMQLQQYHDLSAWGYPAVKLDKALLNWGISYYFWAEPDASDAQYIRCANIFQRYKLRPFIFTWKQNCFLILFKYCPLLFEPVCVLYKKIKKVKQRM